MISELYNEQMGRYFAKLAQTQTNISETATNTAVGNFPPPQIIKTNADRIRAMTDEELAKFLCWLNVECYQCPGEDMCSIGQNGMLIWLKEETKDG